MWSPQGYLWLLGFSWLLFLASGSLSVWLLPLAVLGTHLKRVLEVQQIREELRKSPDHVIIVGAGFSGLSMAKNLQDRGIRYTVLEKGPDLGGTWLYNTYPGSGCDIPSHLYCFSWYPNPTYSKKWVDQPEILEYMRSLVQEFNLRPQMRFGATVREMVWNESRRAWDVIVACQKDSVTEAAFREAGYEKVSAGSSEPGGKTRYRRRSDPLFDSHGWELVQAQETEEKAGDRPSPVGSSPRKRSAGQNNVEEVMYRVSAPVVVCGTGQLSNPQLPAGVESTASVFQGEQFHSACWKHDVDLRGKRVVCVGNGASAIQLIPPVAKTAGHLKVFQRSPSWIGDKHNTAYPSWLQSVFRWMPFVLVLHRWYLYWYFERAWLAFRSKKPNRALWLLRKFWLDPFLKSQVKDAQLLDKVHPMSLPGCKRILGSRDYYAALQRPNVELITSAVTEVLPTGVRDSQGQIHECDVIIWATGFRTQQFCYGMKIVGRDGMCLEELFQKDRGGPQAYLGVCLPNMPNFWALYFVHTNLGHNSILLMIEAQTRYIVDAIQLLFQQRRLAGDRNRGLTLEVKPEVAAQFTREVRERLGKSIFASGCTSWYTQDGETPSSKPESRETREMGTLPRAIAINNWCGSTIEYMWRLRQFNLTDYILSSSSLTTTVGQ